MTTTQIELIKRLQEKIRRLEYDLRLIRSIVNGKMETDFVYTIKSICAKALEEKG